MQVMMLAGPNYVHTHTHTHTHIPIQQQQERREKTAEKKKKKCSMTGKSQLKLIDDHSCMHFHKT